MKFKIAAACMIIGTFCANSAFAFSTTEVVTVTNTGLQNYFVSPAPKPPSTGALSIRVFPREYKLICSPISCVKGNTYGSYKTSSPIDNQQTETLTLTLTSPGPTPFIFINFSVFTPLEPNDWSYRTDFTIRPHGDNPNPPKHVYITSLRSEYYNGQQMQCHGEVCPGD